MCSQSRKLQATEMLFFSLDFYYFCSWERMDVLFFMPWTRTRGVTPDKMDL